MVPNFIKQALLGEPITVYGDGSHTRSFGYFDDIIDGVWRLANTQFHEPVNIGTEEERTVLEFAQAVIAATGSQSKIEHLDAAVDDPKMRRPDLSRARSLLGWEPKTSLEDGLKMTIPYFRQKLKQNPLAETV